MNLQQFLADEKKKREAQTQEESQAKRDDLSVLMEMVSQVIGQNAALVSQNEALSQRVVSLEARQPDVRTEVREISVTSPSVVVQRPAGWDVKVIRDEGGMISRLEMRSL